MIYIAQSSLNLTWIAVHRTRLLLNRRAWQRSEFEKLTLNCFLGLLKVTPPAFGVALQLNGKANTFIGFIEHASFHKVDL